jgi:hypothetical protein
MRHALVGLCLVALLYGVAASQSVYVGGTYQEGYKAGCAEANDQIRSMTATIYSYGTPDGLEFLDQDTGLPYQRIAGCVVDRFSEGRAAGHNDRIGEYIKKHGYPDYSLKRWEKELFGLKDYYQARSKTEPSHRLTFGGPAMKSPDGKYTIRPVKSQSKRDDGSFRDELKIVVGSGGIMRPALNLWSDAEKSELIWGPKGSGFAIISIDSNEYSYKYMALDLRRGEWLREELEFDGGRFPWAGSERAEIRARLSVLGKAVNLPDLPPLAPAPQPAAPGPR